MRWGWVAMAMAAATAQSWGQSRWASYIRTQLRRDRQRVLHGKVPSRIHCSRRSRRLDGYALASQPLTCRPGYQPCLPEIACHVLDLCRQPPISLPRRLYSSQKRVAYQDAARSLYISELCPPAQSSYWPSRVNARVCGSADATDLRRR